MKQMPKTELSLFERQLNLFRYPQLNNEELQAWDAGDEYVINHVESLNLQEQQKILLLNDNFGALACWFSERHLVCSVTDSHIAHKGALSNLAANKCQKVEFLSSTDPLPNDVDLVLIQIPKNNRYLSWQLTQLRKSIPAHCQVIAVNKAKDIHSSTLKLFERYLGHTTTSLAWKKHRLVFCSVDKSLMNDVPDHTTWLAEEHSIQLANLPNVFSGESLDLGARYFLPHIPKDSAIKHIIDLGCGNGVLSVKAAQLNPNARITSVDESYMSVAAARLNLEQNLNHDSVERFQCVANNCLDGFEEKSADLVLCNPPFHQQNAITDHIAWQMFCDAKHVLEDEGRLLVIGNRHLRYDVKLVRLFGKAQVKTVATNNKFVILQAIKR